MKLKYLGIIMLVLLNCFFVAAAGSLKDYKPDWFSENWGGEKELEWGVLYNFWVMLSPFAFSYEGSEKVDPYSSADKYGWYNKSFFGLANWERDVCLADLSSDVRNIRNVIEDTILEETSIYTTTVTISGTRDLGFNNSWLYEVSWYIMPYGNDAYYRVYLTNGSGKEYFAGKKGTDDNDWVLVSKYSGASNYNAKYITNDFKKAVLEYRDYGSDAVNEMNVSVVDKNAVKT